MDIARTAQKLREQMVRFSGELSTGLPKVLRRFVAEMVFGIQARGSVRLTEVGRALGERISLKKTEERLSRQLGRRAGPRDPAPADRTRRAAHRRRHAAGLGPVGRDQKVCGEDGVLGPSQGRRREGVGLGVLDAEHRGREHERDENRPSLWAVVLPRGGGSPERERGDSRGGRGGVGRGEEAGHMGHGPGWRQGLCL